MKKLEFNEEQWKKIFDAIEEQTVYEIKRNPDDYHSSAAPFTEVWHLLEEDDDILIRFRISRMERIEKYDRVTDKFRSEHRFQLGCYGAEYNDASANKTELPMEFCDTINARIKEIEIIKEQ